MQSRRRILIVEDHEDTAETLAQWFAVHGFEVDIANDRDVALRKVTDSPPHVIFSDFSMHGLGAETFVRHCRAVCPKCKIAFMSAAKDADEASKKLGIETCFVKPFNPDELYQFASASEGSGFVALVN